MRARRLRLRWWQSFFATFSVCSVSLRFGAFVFKLPVLCSHAIILVRFRHNLTFAEFGRGWI
uniref:Uncharacterized protein n=1 Tax=Rhizophora mucronata TaxID=61149 RepID=A0A2P2QC26_RHIMU